MQSPAPLSLRASFPARRFDLVAAHWSRCAIPWRAQRPTGCTCLLTDKRSMQTTLPQCGVAAALSLSLLLTAGCDRPAVPLSITPPPVQQTRPAALDAAAMLTPVLVQPPTSVVQVSAEIADLPPVDSNCGATVPAASGVCGAGVPTASESETYCSAGGPPASGSETTPLQSSISPLTRRTRPDTDFQSRRHGISTSLGPPQTRRRRVRRTFAPRAGLRERAYRRAAEPVGRNRDPCLGSKHTHARAARRRASSRRTRRPRHPNGRARRKLHRSRRVPSSPSTFGRRARFPTRNHSPPPRSPPGLRRSTKPRPSSDPPAASRRT